MLEGRNGMLHYFSDESSAHYHIITGLMFATWKLEFAMEDSDREVRWRPPHPNHSVRTPREKGGGAYLKTIFLVPWKSSVGLRIRRGPGTHPLDSPMVWLMDMASALNAWRPINSKQRHIACHLVTCLYSVDYVAKN